MKDAILDAAERHARRGGYHGFSFRNLAAEVGIKSASVHYHFATKGDLVAALAERYMARMRDTLGDASSLSASVAIKRLSEVFVNANETDDQMCLCGILGAEEGGLPEQLRPKITACFDLTMQWLEVALRRAGKGPKPVEVIAALEGGLIIARAKRDPSILRGVVSALLART
jgi:TetR/AcrR family transcriptional repressor of nem operon